MAGQHRLREETADGEHRKAAVGELLHLQLLFLRRVSGETKRVETVVARLAARSAEHLVDGDGGEQLEEAW
eukprot:CAMPEP_0181258516 /NCGR_PEP_ID=MMETSP1096-20121128/50819_1 /TAXON_ID=156174 ORGANISM="Chrysochromulina ericina, Strain CCMP281" /NCGR_SAMPLE_ID=MMETSP1096 /ASSEMBLY_ACC=CAM_ASM_000453 /LENGTH=70 /DNA_ID=CAMNT_0023356905 /DNA_START=715 /DNA_END=927 /DNA_ORIENTATION=+